MAAEFRVVEETYANGRIVYVVQEKRKFLWWSWWTYLGEGGDYSFKSDVTYDILEEAVDRMLRKQESIRNYTLTKEKVVYPIIEM